MMSQWADVGAETDPLRRARHLQRSWERLLAEGGLGLELSPEATAGLRPTIVESWRRSFATDLDPTGLVPPVEADPSEMQERWLEHPLGALAHVLAARLGAVAEESESLVVVADASGLLLHVAGAEWLKERAHEMNFLVGASLSEAVDGTNGIGTPLAADHPLQVATDASGERLKRDPAPRRPTHADHPAVHPADRPLPTVSTRGLKHVGVPGRPAVCGRSAIEAKPPTT